MVKAEVKSNQKKGFTVTDLYLISYNGIQTIGWSYLLYQLLTYPLTAPAGLSLYEATKRPLAVFQNAAILEVAHAALGLVRSDPILAAFQVASRVLVVGGVLAATLAARESFGLGLSLLAWSLTEVVRYSLYTWGLVGEAPKFLKYLRYTLFIGLYPLGITGELLCIYAAQREVGDKNLYSIQMPNKYNFIFNYQHVLIFIMLLYIPLFPQLYLHMFSQRKKVLGTKKAD